MLILDAACGGKMMWFDKTNPDVVFGDVRRADMRLVDGLRFVVRPDVQFDFRALPFPDATFGMVVFDPPHLLRAGPRSWQAAKYGKLAPTWKDDLRAGFAECWRVLATDGTLIFKWNDYQLPTREILELAPSHPLFGHKTKATTKWFVFVKPQQWLDDGFGNMCSIRCPACGRDTMQIVRPGKFQCSECGGRAVEPLNTDQLR